MQEGWAAEHADVPFWPLRCDPYSVVDESERAGKPKFRLTNDHSWPPPCSVSLDGSLSNAQGQFVSSLNASMVRDDWPEARLLRVREVAEAAAVLQSSGVPVKAGVLDGVAYYKMFGRQAAELHRNGAVTEAGFLVEDRCCFGSAADAAKCCRASNFFVHHARLAMREVDAMYPAREPALLEWLAERRAKALELGCSEEEVEEQWTCLFALGMYVDDASHVSVDDLLFTANGEPLMRDGRQVRRATAHFEALRSTFHRFGLNTAKEQPPSECVELLGVELNLSEQRMRLTQRKRAKYAALCSEMAGRKVCGFDRVPRAAREAKLRSYVFPERETVVARSMARGTSEVQDSHWLRGAVGVGAQVVDCLGRGAEGTGARWSAAWSREVPFSRQSAGYGDLCRCSAGLQGRWLRGVVRGRRRDALLRRSMVGGGERVVTDLRSGVGGFNLGVGGAAAGGS